MGRLSWVREALKTGQTPRSGRPFLDLIKMCGAMGSTAAETACVLQVTVEKLMAAMDGDETISVHDADRLRMYLEVLWWWHCYRSKRADFRQASFLKAVFLRSRPIWLDLPRRLVDDWEEAHWRYGDTADVSSLI